MTADVYLITIADIEFDVIAQVLAADEAERGGDDRRRLQTWRSEPSGPISFPLPSTSRVWRVITRKPTATGCPT